MPGLADGRATAALVALIAFLVAMLMAGLLAAFSRVSGLFRNGLLEPESLGGVLRRHLQESRRFTALVGTLYLAATAVACVAAGRWLDLVRGGAVGARHFVLVVLTIVIAWSLGGAVARLLSAGDAVATARLLCRLLVPVAWLLRPWSALLVAVASRLDETVWNVDGMPQLSTDEIRSLLSDEEDGVSLEDDEREMIESIFSFHETAVKEIMVPRIDMVALDAKSSVLDAVQVVEECRHSRIPVYEGSVDRITGLLYAKDLLGLVREGRLEDEGKVVGDLARPAYFIPESKRLDEVLAEFRSQRIHMAVLIDEYGGTAGIVTMEDVLEEIVGEIEDEFDEDETLFDWIDDRTLRVDPKIGLDDLQELLGVALPLDVGSETLAGLIYDAAGKVPEQGDRVAIAGLDIEVERVEDQRIMQVLIAAEKPLRGRATPERES